MFKDDFKYYKRRCPPPIYDNVIDFKYINDSSEEFIQRLPCIPHEYTKLYCKKYGLVELSQWKIYEFKNRAGLIFIQNPFTKEGQQYWIQRCLEDYTKKPNKLNIDPFNELEPNENWWDVAQIDSDRGKKLLNKLRWATLGYHHNWDTKEYSDKDRTEFPADLAELSSLVIAVLDDPAGHPYQAQAAIVNFYHMDSTLSGHKDVSEPNMLSPLLSISFGQTAVFLVGGDTLEEPATAMFLRSGDLVVMSGQARLSYHGVPRILPSPDRPWADNSPQHSFCNSYLDTARININIRQVLLPGQQSIKS